MKAIIYNSIKYYIYNEVTVLKNMSENFIIFGSLFMQSAEFETTSETSWRLLWIQNFESTGLIFK